MIELLIRNPLLLLFIVATLGFSLGLIRIKGCSLGVSAVLFAGLFVGALHPELKIPELFYLFGLTLFVYTIGLNSGPAFFRSFRREGLRETGFVVGLLVLAAAMTVVLQALLGFDPLTASGMFAGSLNNTPALATILDQLKHWGGEMAVDTALNQPVVGYSLSYPLGVLIPIVAITAFQKLWKIDYKTEASPGQGAHGELAHRTVLVTRPTVVSRKLEDLRRENSWNVVFGRMRRGPTQQLITTETTLAQGDEVGVIGFPEQLDQVQDFLGEQARQDLSADRSQFDYRRIFVSNRSIVGIPIGELDFLKAHEATITRIRRGDVDLLPSPRSLLEPGDRVRVICRPEIMDEVTHFFGDSYKAVSEIDVLSFSAGLALGILFGLIPFPLPGGVTLTFGFAGGPLIVGLILGKIHRTGPVVWVLPYGASLMLRQIGLVLFLAGVGTRAGYTFFNTLLHGDGLLILAAGSVITFTCIVAAFWVGYRLLRIPMGRLVGIISGLMTQPAVLGFALEQTRNDEPNAGYAMVHPIATITKIVLAQILLSWLALQV